jgi:putative endonuclease
MFYTYIIISPKTGILYKGFTTDLEKRLEEHNSGLSNYTSKHIPWKLVLFEEHSTKKEALKREKWYKTGVGRDWIKQQLFENKD